LIPQRLLVNWQSRTKRRLAQSKGLTNRSGAERMGDFFEFWRDDGNVAACLLITKGLLEKLVGKTGEGLVNLKGLLAVLALSGRTTFSGLVRRLERGASYLLIRQGLLAKLLRKTAEGLVNLKGLLTLFRAEPRELI
jgi:hypothetical protein